ncbi:MAG: HAMP domain-containing histidine kinase [Sulfurimonas sp.]|nr:HAMP domain-containing histidine kinase [Sulfurimonas sp.]
MKQNKNFFFENLLFSGHTFSKDEILLKYQYKILNIVLIVVAIFSFLFSTLSVLDINPLGIIQTVTNYILVVFMVFIMIWLRGSKKHYIQSAYLMYLTCFLDFLIAFIFVPDDEFRMIWFYLLAFSAYLTGGTKAGNTIIILSIAVILLGSIFIDTQLSQKAIISSVLGLIIAMLFFRSYTIKIFDFEKEITEQKSLMITQSRFAAMGEMMSMIAHQWRQPLSTTTLMIANERVKSMVKGKELTEHDKILEKISDTMIYLSDTIDDFQTYFKPEKSTQKIEISKLIQRTRQFTDTRLKVAKIKLHVEEYKNESIEIYVNEVIQALLNICNNAIDILQDRDVNDRHLWISIKSTDNNLIISIEDNGGGIDEDIIEKIFDPYFSKKSKNGTGLGLYMAKMIIETHLRGALSVVNTSKGACFSVSLPKHSKALET